MRRGGGVGGEGSEGFREEGEVEGLDFGRKETTASFFVEVF